MSLLPASGTVYVLSTNTNEKKQNRNVPTLLISRVNLPRMITAHVSFVSSVSFSLTEPWNHVCSQEGMPSQVHGHLYVKTSQLTGGKEKRSLRILQIKLP